MISLCEGDARVRLAVPIAAAASTVVGGAPTVVVVVVVVVVVLLRTVAVQKRELPGKD